MYVEHLLNVTILKGQKIISVTSVFLPSIQSRYILLALHMDLSVSQAVTKSAVGH